MSDDNPFERKQPPPCLTVAQQDRAAGLLVGMAVGESMMLPDRNEHNRRRHSDGLTDRALVAVEQDQPEPFQYQEHIEFDSWDVRLAFSHVTGAVLRDLHLSPEDVFRSAYASARGDANEMGFGHPQIMGEAYALWAVMLHQSVLTGEADLRAGLPFVSNSRPLMHGTYLDWADRIQDMERGSPQDLSWAGPYDLLHAAWAAVSASSIGTGPRGFATGMNPAPNAQEEWIVGPFVGAALGALHGYSAIPWAWRRFFRDMRGNSAEHLMRSAVSATLGFEYWSDRWPDFQRVEPQESASPATVVVHPSDPGVLLGGVGALEGTRAEAAVSLCNAGAKLPSPRGTAADHAVFWLVDSDDPRDNSHLSFVLEDAAHAVLTLRKEGKTVLLHGLTGESRTPAVASLYGALISGRSAWEELQRIARALPQTAPNAGFLRHLASTDARSPEPTDEPTPERPLQGDPAIPRQLIELFSWTIADRLLEYAMGNASLEHLDGSLDGFAVFLDSDTRVEFLVTGDGITVDNSLMLSWSRVINMGSPQEVATYLAARSGLLLQIPMISTAAVSTWHPSFAAALMRQGFWRARTLRVRPLEPGPDQRMYIDYSFGPDLLCEVNGVPFIVREQKVFTETLVFGHQNIDETDPERAALQVLDQLIK